MRVVPAMDEAGWSLSFASTSMPRLCTPAPDCSITLGRATRAYPRSAARSEINSAMLCSSECLNGSNSA